MVSDGEVVHVPRSPGEFPISKPSNRGLSDYSEAVNDVSCFVTNCLVISFWRQKEGAYFAIFGIKVEISWLEHTTSTSCCVSDIVCVSQQYVAVAGGIHICRERTHRGRTALLRCSCEHHTKIDASILSSNYTGRSSWPPLSIQKYTPNVHPVMQADAFVTRLHAIQALCHDSCPGDTVLSNLAGACVRKVQRQGRSSVEKV